MAFMPGVELKMDISEAPDMRLLLLNRADNVALVRQALHGLADAILLDEHLLSDIKTAVSEACNNVVLHAYHGEEGLLEVYVCPAGEDLQIVVRDEGTGIEPRRPRAEAGVQGVGLSLIQALTDRVEFRGTVGEGTEVRMHFTCPVPVDIDVADSEGAVDQVRPPRGETVVSVAAGSLAAPLLGRVVALLAARANLSVERLADAQLVSDAIAAHAPTAMVGRHIHMGFEVQPRTLELRAGPLRPGGARRVVDDSAVAGLQSVIESLADEVDIEADDETEELRLQLSDPR